MSSPPESAVFADKQGMPIAERRADVEAKQAQLAALLGEVECDALLLLDPANFAWLTGGSSPRSIIDPEQWPGLFVGADVRSLLASNVDSQRLFDLELDGLGFQLKEWSWHAGRESLLTHLCRGRRIGCDVPRPDCKLIADRIRPFRYVITEHELTPYRRLGHLLSHALEATCRSTQQRQPEQEIAGHLAHRVLRHGAELVSVEVTADDRLRQYRRPGFTAAQVMRHCVITATVRQQGLYVTASRSLSFGPPDPAFRAAHDAATKVTASYIASSWPDAVPGAILTAGQRVYKINQYEHEWRCSPAGWITGRSAVEQLLTAQVLDTFQPGWAVTWRAGAGAACSCDTFVVTTQGPILITAPANWPKKRILIQGAHFDRPDILQR